MNDHINAHLEVDVVAAPTCGAVEKVVAAAHTADAARIAVKLLL